MNLSKYRDAAERGLVKTQVAGNALIFEEKRFDPETGEALPPQMSGMTRAEIETQLEAALERVAALDAMLAKLDG